MKKLLLVSALCVLLVPVSAFAANIGSGFTNLSGVVKNGASVTIITTNGTKLKATPTKLTGGGDEAILGAVDANLNQEFVDTIIFNEGTLKIRGTLLASKGKASGPADFLFQSSTTFVKGAAEVKIVGPTTKKGKTTATVLITFLTRSAGLGNSTSINATSTLDAKMKLPAMQKKGILTNLSSTLF